MPVLARRRSVRILLVLAAGFPLLLAGGAAIFTVVIGQSCSGSGVGDAPSPVAVRDVPASMLVIYQQVGAQYKLPWEILAGIGEEECHHGRDRDPSCTPLPGAKGPGVANAAGASGPMQVGIGGAAGDEYDALRHFLPNPSLGPHDPATAVELAALVLIKDKGAPTGQPIDAYTRLRARVQRRRPDGGGIRRSCAGRRPHLPGRRDNHRRSRLRCWVRHAGRAWDEGADPRRRRRRRARRRARGGAGDDRRRQPDQPLPLQLRRRAWRPSADDEPDQPEPGRGAGRGGERRTGYDCSSATSYVLWGGGLGHSLLAGGVLVSGDLESVGDPGPGKWVTIYASAGHAYIEVAGVYLDTAAGLGNPPNPPPTGPRWSTVGTGPVRFVARHPPGL